jgi:hypothetical protein
MRVLVLNDSYFGSSLNQENVEILRVGPGKTNDIQMDPDVEDLSQILAESGFKPDAILQIDSIDQRVFFKGLDKLDVPKAFYAIDAPINEFWQKHYAHQFDRIWVDQHEVWKKWQNEGITWSRWLPLAADETIFHADDTEKDIPVVFVGTLDHERRPKRSAILYRLKQITDVEVVHGDGTRSVPAEEVAHYYRRAKIVLNELLFDGVNLRTFEAMACGAVVLTERNRGEERLFNDGYDLAGFDAKDLEQVVYDLLNNEELRQQIATEGANKIKENHTVHVRARQVLRELNGLEKRTISDSTQQETEIAWGLLQASLKWEYLENLKRETVNKLSSSSVKLDPFRQAVITELKGDKKEAFKILSEEYDKGNPSQYLKLNLAMFALVNGEIDFAKDLLKTDASSSDEIQVAIGNQLLGLGYDLTPGINRMKSPLLLWNAFEHFNYIFGQNEDNLEALKGLDKVLSRHKSPEFTLALWQKFHMRNPKDMVSRKMLMTRARSGYFMPGEVSARKGENVLPLSNDSRATGERTLSSGQTRSA